MKIFSSAHGLLSAVRATIVAPIIATILCIAPRITIAQQLHIQSGAIVGVTDEDVIAYKGIPYAAPPVGQRRWQAPQPAPSWSGVRNADTFGPACAQPLFAPSAWAKNGSEDCLTINVWTPARKPDRAMPVLFVIPGGAFFGGGGSDPRTNPRELVKRGIVVVTLNYRLGVFGFYAHPMLSKESRTHTSGNYGLMDQIAALQWVKNNIATFGGDPHNVTIEGCSAGGSSVLYLMVSPLARGLFVRGISESAALVYAPVTHLKEGRYSRQSAEASGLQLGADIDALRALSAEELLARSAIRTDLMYSDGIDYWPIVDGVVVPDEPAKLFDDGKFSRTPLIIGTTVDEATLFASTLPIKSVEAWQAHITKRHPGAESTALKAYAASTDADVRAAATRWVNEWFFHGTARAVARAVASRGVPVYLYSFSRVPRAQPLRAGAGAFHSVQMEYVFNRLLPPWGKPEQFDDVDRGLARDMSGAWVQFATNGTPNNSTLPVWPRYDRLSDQYLDFGSAIRSSTSFHGEPLDMSDRIFNEMRSADSIATKRRTP